MAKCVATAAMILPRQYISPKLTADLKKQRHGVKVVEGKLQIVPHDNHDLLRRLRAGVEELVDTATADPNFA